MKSMTGYGRARQVLHGRTVTVELRAVNHRDRADTVRRFDNLAYGINSAEYVGKLRYRNNLRALVYAAFNPVKVKRAVRLALDKPKRRARHTAYGLPRKEIAVVFHY